MEVRNIRGGEKWMAAWRPDKVPFVFPSFLIKFLPFPLMEVAFQGEKGKQRLCFLQPCRAARLTASVTIFALRTVSLDSPREDRVGALVATLQLLSTD